MRRLLLLLLFPTVLACEATLPEGRYQCEVDEDCPDEMVCRVDRNRCYLTRDGGE